MYHHCEIVMPPTDDVNAALESVLKPFDESDEDNAHPFWDFWVIGGRWAGTKLMAKYDDAKLKEFHQWMQDQKITVSGFLCGKEELKPAIQIQKVDAKWNELFPHESGEQHPCAMFRHSNDQYGRDGTGAMPGDICLLSECNGVKCSRVIVAGPGWDRERKEHCGSPEATFMICDSVWNGANHMKVAWDGTLAGAMKQCRKNMDNYADDYREMVTPRDEWLVVTVDFHS